jgi:hypothetical protein
MTGPTRRVVCEETTPLRLKAGAVDLDYLRSVFAELFDRVLGGVQRAGLDCDDVVLERAVLVGVSRDQASWQLVTYLSQMELFEAELRRWTPKNVSLSDVMILGARVTAVADSMA